MTSRTLKVACSLLIAALAGCQTSKSSSPLAPTVAGPIDGVTISAPIPLEPSQGFKFKGSEQPIKLVVQNATTNGVRPLTYTFEVSGDSGFASKVFSRANVAPGDGRTSVVIDKLEIGRTYYWRAWAEDGANTGAKAGAGFDIYPQAQIGAPAAASPVNNEQIATVAPVLVVNNASTVGPVGNLTYEFQVASDQAFTHVVSAGTVSEVSGQTRYSSVALANSATFY